MERLRITDKGKGICDYTNIGTYADDFRKEYGYDLYNGFELTCVNYSQSEPVADFVYFDGAFFKRG